MEKRSMKNESNHGIYHDSGFNPNGSLLYVFCILAIATYFEVRTNRRVRNRMHGGVRGRFISPYSIVLKVSVTCAVVLRVFCTGMVKVEMLPP